VDLGEARENKKIKIAHSELMGNVSERVSKAKEAFSKAHEAGFFDGFEKGDVLKGRAHPFKIEGHFVRKWKPSPFVTGHFDRFGAKPSIIEHEGEQYVPMTMTSTGKEGTDSWSQSEAYTDVLRAANYPKMGGLRSVKASGGAVDPDPTDAQKEVGNYKKEHVSFQGVPVSIENKKGSMRSGTSKNGRHWSVEMPYDYGYVKGTKGADGDHLDVCIGPNVNSDSVFIVDQKDANTGKFDEHKAMLGYNTLSDAETAYKSGFSDGKGHLRMGPIVRMTIAEFKKWYITNETKTANKTQELVDRALKIAVKSRPLSGDKNVRNG